MGLRGQMRPEYYADLYRRYQTYVRQYGKTKFIKLLAVLVIGTSRGLMF